MALVAEMTRCHLGTTRQLQPASQDLTSVELTGKSVWPSWSVATISQPACLL